MADVDSAPQQQVCQGFLRGKCHRGKNCRFLHDKNAKTAGAKPRTAKQLERDKRQHDTSAMGFDDDEDDDAGASLRIPACAELDDSDDDAPEVPSGGVGAVFRDAREVEAAVELSAEELAERNAESKLPQKEEKADEEEADEEAAREREKQKLLAVAASAIPGLGSDEDSQEHDAAPPAQPKKAVTVPSASRASKQLKREELEVEKRKTKKREAAAARAEQRATKLAKLQSYADGEDSASLVRENEWEHERQRIVNRMQEEKDQSKKARQEAGLAARKQAIEEVGEDLMSEADLMWAEVQKAQKGNKRKKPKGGR